MLPAVARPEHTYATFFIAIGVQARIGACCSCRDKCLRDAGFEDPFFDVKSSENAKALELLPTVLRYLPRMHKLHLVA